MKDWVALLTSTEEMQGRYEGGRSTDGEGYCNASCRHNYRAGLAEGASIRQGERITDVDCVCCNEQRGGEAAGARIAVCDCLDSDMESGGRRGRSWHKDMSGFFNMMVFIGTICSSIHWR